VEIEVRKVTSAADLTVVRDLMCEYGVHLAHHPAGPEHFCVSGLETELAGLPNPYVAPGCILLAKVDGQPGGCVALRGLSGAGNPLEIKRLWVRPAFRAIGLGRQLMTEAIEHAKAAGASAIYLDTVPAAMPEANRLYASLGFVETEPYNSTRVPGIAFFRLDL
jgi:GNAT superfamily N-acetyltransferase